MHHWDIGRPHRHAQDCSGLSGGAAGTGWDVWKMFPVYPARSVCCSSCWGGKWSEGATQTGGFKFEICPWPTSIRTSPMSPDLLLVSPSTHGLLIAAPSHGTVTFWVVPVARWCWDPPRAEHGIRDMQADKARTRASPKALRHSGPVRRELSGGMEGLQGPH